MEKYNYFHVWAGEDLSLKHLIRAEAEANGRCMAKHAYWILEQYFKEKGDIKNERKFEH